MISGSPKVKNPRSEGKNHCPNKNQAAKCKSHVNDHCDNVKVLSVHVPKNFKCILVIMRI